ncbi:fibrous sheath-interacting protein 1 [Callorhinchus milii]|uniref:fibrous sheath-interacting protein 1 n=1 Tax=Callorhinchus milii TaxID=7868 RepID=UPI001C3F9220|nr:fibrous sheath-interacting protein 1 [Callorhinchus milii]
MDITRGSLDEISSPASGSQSRLGSRVVSSVSPDGRRLNVQSTGTLTVLTPEPNLSQEQPNTFENSTTSMEFLSESLFNSSCEILAHEGDLCNDQEDMNTVDADIAYPGRGYLPQEQIHSEHQALLTSVKSENLSTPKDSEEDSEDHLQQTPTLKNESDNSKQEDLYDKFGDPQLQEAVLKMKRLDKLLKEKQEKEKEVNEQGRVLRKKLWEELEEKSEKEAQKAAPNSNAQSGMSLKEKDAYSEGVEDSHEVSENALRFLALTPSYSKNSTTGEDLSVGPIFHTQLPLEEYERCNKEGGQECHISAEGVQLLPDISENTPNQDESKEKSSPKKGSQTSKDFIKKNIQLAKEARNLVLLTSDEKERLAELLKNVDTENDNRSSNEESLELWATSKPEQDGYTSELTYLQQLDEINSRLNMLVPDENFSVTDSTQSEYQSKNSLLEETATRFLEGDEIIQQLREEREQNLKLNNIDEQLKNLQKASQEQALQSYGTLNLSQVQLNSLLNDCIRWQNLLQVSETPELEENVSYTSGFLCSPGTSPSSSVYNKPKLSESTLSQLLEDAHSPRLSTVHSAVEGENGKMGEEKEDPSYYLSKALANSSSLRERFMAISSADYDGREMEEKQMSCDNEESYLTRALGIKQVKKPSFLNDQNYCSDTDQEPTTDSNIAVIPQPLHRDTENAADNDEEIKEVRE